LVIPIFVANWRVKHETEIIPARRDSLPDNLGQFSAFDIRIHRAVIFAFMGISAIGRSHEVALDRADVAAD